jgi:hypothetical protein
LSGKNQKHIDGALAGMFVFGLENPIDEQKRLVPVEKKEKWPPVDR